MVLLGRPAPQCGGERGHHRPGKRKWVSPASYWETAIKISTGKYALAQPYEDFWRNAIDGNGFRILHVLPSHTSLLTKLNYDHRDPFDRMIIAQALSEGLTVLSADRTFKRYKVKLLW